MPVGKFKNRPLDAHFGHRFLLLGKGVTADCATRQNFGAGTIFASCSERSIAGINRPRRTEKRVAVDG